MSKENLKVLCVLCDDPVDKFPPDYARIDIPKISSYPDSQSTAHSYSKGNATGGSDEAARFKES